jgi:hypothetical protein
MGALQQVSVAAGVAVAGAVLEAGMAVSGSTEASLSDFSAAFYVVGAITAASALVFLSMTREAGDGVAGRRLPAE